jgi:hypothetical protein
MKKSSDQLKREIDKRQKEIISLSKELSEVLEYENGLRNGDARAIAEYMHDRQCRENHTDSCDWYYGSWTSEPLSYARQEYLDKAGKFISIAQSKNIPTSEFLDLVKLFLT